MKRILLPLLLLALAAPASAELVGLWTFARSNALEAKVGTDAIEGTGRNPVATSATTNALYAVTDAAVLGDRTGVLAVPKGSGILIPVPDGLTGTYCLTFDFFIPEYKQWVSLFSLDQRNNSDGFLFVRNGTDIGKGGYDTVGTVDTVIGAWHQLVISMDAGTGTLWYDGTRLPSARSWNLSGKDYFLFAMDEDGDDNLIYVDEVRFYDEATPAAVFPVGSVAAVFPTDRDDGTPLVTLMSAACRLGVVSLAVELSHPGDATCTLEALVTPDGGSATAIPLESAAAAGSYSFDLDDTGLADGTHFSVCVRATGDTEGKSALTASRNFVFSSGTAAGSLVGQWTFARDNPLVAKIGTDALEGTSRSPVATSVTTNTLYAVTDPAVLGDRTGVLAVPTGSGILIPVPDGISDTYCFTFDFYAPVYQMWYSFFSLDQNNASDGWFWIRSGNEIGSRDYDSVGSVIGAWHQIAISMDAGSGTVWYDGTRLPTARSWNLSGKTWILLAMDESGDDPLIYFDEARFYAEARPADVFPDGVNASVYATDRDDGTPVVSLGTAAVSSDGLSLRLSVTLSDAGDATCSLAALVSADGGAETSFALTNAVTPGLLSFSPTFAALGLSEGESCTVRIVATGTSRGRSATSESKAFVVPSPDAAAFGETYAYSVSIQRVAANGTLERLGEGENTLLLFATGADGVRHTLASLAVSATGSFAIDGVFPGTGTVEAQVVCSNETAGVSHVAALPSATLVLGADSSTYYRNAANADAAWNDPAAWTATGLSVADAAGFPSETTDAYFSTAGATTTRLPAGTWKANLHFERPGVTNVFAGEGVGVSVLDVPFWFKGQDVRLVVTNATFLTDGFGFRMPRMTLRIDDARWVPSGQMDLADRNGLGIRLEIANGGAVEMNNPLLFGSTNAVLFVDGGTLRSLSSFGLSTGPCRLDVTIPETAPTAAPVQFASMARTVPTGEPLVVNIVENRSQMSGNLPILSVEGGIPDGLVSLGSVPYSDRGERLFFGYDGTDAETGTLRSGVWYRSRPILPTVILVR